MSDKVYDVPAEWAKRAWVNAAKYKEMYQRSISDPEAFWAEHGKRIDWFKPYTKVKNTSFDAHNVSIKWFEDGVTNVAHNCIDRHLPKRASQTAIIWEGDDPSKSEAHHLCRACGSGGPFRQRAERPRRQEGRSRHHLSADDSRGGLRDARLRAHRRDPFGRVRRLLARRPRRPHRRRQIRGRDHRRRRSARRPEGAAQGQCRRGDRESGRRQDRDRRQAYRRRRRLATRARRLAARSRTDGDGGLSGGADERGGPAVHPLHVRLDRRAQGRRAHHRRLSRLCRR